jgi:hypothetical protein
MNERPGKSKYEAGMMNDGLRKRKDSTSVISLS